MSTVGWTIEQWRQFAVDNAPETVLATIQDLVASFSRSDPAWISIAAPEVVAAQWEALLHRDKPQTLPLFGVPYAVKDNIDVRGFNTTAACPAFENTPPADATIVGHLRQAGAIVVGKTNLDQFATGLVGTRSPYGRPPCVFSDTHVSGGSSSGSASVVGRGLVPFALGTDTAGSGRVPAALNNLVGLKPSRGALSCKGVLPACKSLDCPSIFSLTLRDAQLVYSVTAQYDEEDEYSRRLPERLVTTFGPNPVFAVPKTPLFFGDKHNPVLYEAALKRLQAGGVTLVPTDFSPLFELAALLYDGPWVCERYAAIEDFIASHAQDMDPVVRQIIQKAQSYSGSAAFKSEYKRRRLLNQIDQTFGAFDGLVVPTCPLNPTFADIEQDPILHNSRQGTYTNFVNLADMSALAVPAGFRPDGLANGITFISQKFNDYALLDVASRFLDPARPLGAKLPRTLVAGQQDGDKLHPGIPGPAATPASVPLCVVGGHLSGMALNWQLQAVHATLAATTTTAPHYRLYALPHTSPAKPGLRRVSPSSSSAPLKGAAIAVEVWRVPAQHMGTFLSMVPPPLGLGSVELADGQWVKGFICEAVGYEAPAARDITEYGGWRRYMASL